MADAKPKYKRADSDGKWRTARSRVKSRVRMLKEPCGLCGEPVDLTLPKGDPMAFQVDHIKPVSQGGALTRQSNLQPAHAVCNNRKNDGRPKGKAATAKAVQVSRPRVWAGPVTPGPQRMSQEWMDAQFNPAEEPPYPGVWEWWGKVGFWRKVAAGPGEVIDDE